MIDSLSHISDQFVAHNFYIMKIGCSNDYLSPYREIINT